MRLLSSEKPIGCLHLHIRFTLLLSTIYEEPTPHLRERTAHCSAGSFGGFGALGGQDETRTEVRYCCA